jgi:hypothetical protein
MEIMYAEEIFGCSSNGAKQSMNASNPLKKSFIQSNLVTIANMTDSAVYDRQCPSNTGNATTKSSVQSAVWKPTRISRRLLFSTAITLMGHTHTHTHTHTHARTCTWALLTANIEREIITEVFSLKRKSCISIIDDVSRGDSFMRRLCGGRACMMFGPRVAETSCLRHLATWIANNANSKRVCICVRVRGHRHMTK